jgi:hypothetical protein
MPEENAPAFCREGSGSGLEAVRAQIAEQAALIEQLRQRIHELETGSAKGSRNSRNPPSSDPVKKPPPSLAVQARWAERPSRGEPHLGRGFGPQDHRPVNGQVRLRALPHRDRRRGFAGAPPSRRIGDPPRSSRVPRRWRDLCLRARAAQHRSRRHRGAGAVWAGCVGVCGVHDPISKLE